MALLNGLPPRFDSLVLVLDDAHSDGIKFNFKIVQSRCVQAEQSRAQRARKDLNSEESAAFFAKPLPRTKSTLSTDFYAHCGKHNNVAVCEKTSPTWSCPDILPAPISIDPASSSRRPPWRPIFPLAQIQSLNLPPVSLQTPLPAVLLLAPSASRLLSLPRGSSTQNAFPLSPMIVQLSLFIYSSSLQASWTQVLAHLPRSSDWTQSELIF